MKNTLVTTLSVLLASSCMQLAAQAGPTPLPPALQVDANGNKLDSGSRPILTYSDSNTLVHLYGLIEATIGYATHQTNEGNTSFGYQVAWFSGNRYGIDADHYLAFGDDIGLKDLKAIVKLEGEYELPTGGFDTDNTIFNRDCWMGFYSPDLGKLTFGRQNTLTRDFTQTWGDAYGTPDVTLKEGGYSNVNNFKQFIFYSADPGGTRSNSSIVWKKPVGDNVVVGLSYGFSYAGAGGSADPGSGGEIPGNPSQGQSYAASIAFNHLHAGPGKLSFNLNYDHGSENNTNKNQDYAFLVGGDYIVGQFRLNAGYVYYDGQQGVNHTAADRKDNSWTVSGVYNFTKKTAFSLGYVRFSGKNAGTNSGGVVLNPFFGNTSAVTNATEVNGNKGTVFGSLMYSPDHQVDLYVAFDYMKVGGDYVVGDALGNGGPFGKGQTYSSETEIATGCRFKF